MSHQVQPFTNEEVTLLEEALSAQKAYLETARNRASLSTASDAQANAFAAKIQQLELLLLKVKSFKNN